jgi:PAS domain S-box-containing protein
MEMELMNTGKILIVEDDTIIAMELMERLKELGYDIAAVVSSGIEAINMVAVTEPDLVLMDIRLSGKMDGVEAAEKIRKRFDRPVIFLTAYADDETLYRAKKCEPFGYMLKPFDTRMIHTNIEMALYRHQMEKKLKKNEQKYRSLFEKYRNLFEGVPVGIFRTTPDGKVLDANTALIKILAYPDKASFMNINAKNLYVDANDRKVWEDIVHRDGIVNGVEMQMRRWDDEIVWMRINAKIIQDEQNLIYYEGSLEDITEQKNFEKALRDAHQELEKRVEDRTSELLAAIELLNREIKIRKQAVNALKKSEAELQLLSERLLMIQEEERERMARELHDSVGQNLTFVKMSLEFCLKNLLKQDFEEVYHSLTNLIPSIQKAINEVRHICSGLWPAMLDQVGILKTIQWLCEDFENCNPDLFVDTGIDLLEQDIEKELKIVIYRIVQEAFNNIAKHSRADRVYISIKKDEGHTRLTIRDNGIGFETESFSAKNNHKMGIGLSSMKKRTEVSGGSFFVDSKPGAGTQITAIW